jgi:hypothetical protein
VTLTKQGDRVKVAFEGVVRYASRNTAEVYDGNKFVGYVQTDHPDVKVEVVQAPFVAGDVLLYNDGRGHQTRVRRGDGMWVNAEGRQQAMDAFYEEEFKQVKVLVRGGQLVSA